MTNYEVIETAKQVMKKANSAIAEGNREYTSLSQVLADMQRDKVMKKGYKAAFAALGIIFKENEKLTPRKLQDITSPQQWVEVNVKGEKEPMLFIGIWGVRQKKDAAGAPVVDGEGLPVMEPTLNRVKSWTPRKVFTVIAQAAVLNAGGAEAIASLLSGAEAVMTERKEEKKAAAKAEKEAKKAKKA